MLFVQQFMILRNHGIAVVFCLATYDFQKSENDCYLTMLFLVSELHFFKCRHTTYFGALFFPSVICNCVILLLELTCVKKSQEKRWNSIR